VDDDGTDILKDEDGAPGNLGSHVLDKHFAGGDDAGDISDEFLAILAGCAGGGIVDTDAVVVADAGGLGDGALDIFDGGGWADGEGCREILDGFLGSYRVKVSGFRS
jgi:hypothetical protein